jgi:hypothetical protein
MVKESINDIITELNSAPKTSQRKVSDDPKHYVVFDKTEIEMKDGTKMKLNNEPWKAIANEFKTTNGSELAKKFYLLYRFYVQNKPKPKPTTEEHQE